MNKFLKCRPFLASLTIVAAFLGLAFVRPADAAVTPPKPVIESVGDTVIFQPAKTYRGLHDAVVVYDGSKIVHRTVIDDAIFLPYAPGTYKCFTYKVPSRGTSWSPYSCLTVGRDAPDLKAVSFGNGTAKLAVPEIGWRHDRVKSVRIFDGIRTTDLDANLVRKAPGNSFAFIDAPRKGKWTCYQATYVWDNGYTSQASPWKCGRL